MKLNTILQRMPAKYEEGLSLYLTSAPGRGKTETIILAAKVIGEKLRKNIGIVVINGPLLTPGDGIGYLMPKHCEDGRIESVYSDPFWFRTREGKRLTEYDGGIIFIDEADKMDTDVKKVIGEAALSGRLGPHVIPDGWVIWMAGNTKAHRSGSTKELDHLINRRMQIEVTDDLESWLDWAFEHGVSPLCTAFAKQNPMILLQTDVPKEQGPWCTPRSLVRSDRYLQRLTVYNGGETPDDPETVTEIAGMIGQAAASTLFAFVKLQAEMPRYEKIVADPNGAKVPVKPDMQMLVVYNLAHRVSKTDISPVIQYVERMPKEFAVTFAKAALKRDRPLLLTPAVQAWAGKNASLMAAIGGV